jgi:hypothetical protein
VWIAIYSLKVKYLIKYRVLVMSLLQFYISLIVLGLLLDIAGIVLGNNGGTVEQLAFCFIVSVLLLIVGIRGVAGKLKAYM